MKKTDIVSNLTDSCSLVSFPLPLLKAKKDEDFFIKERFGIMVFLKFSSLGELLSPSESLTPKPNLPSQIEHTYFSSRLPSCE